MLKSQQIISDYYGSTTTAETIIGIGSSDTIVSFMLVITFAVLLLFLIIAGFQAHQERQMERIEDEYSACTVNPPRFEWRPTRKFAAFLSHYKHDCAADARFLHDSLRKMLRCPIYLDSSTLSDLRQLFSDGLLQSDTLVLLASKGVLTRPWCMVCAPPLLGASISPPPVFPDACRALCAARVACR